MGSVFWFFAFVYLCLRLGLLFDPQYMSSLLARRERSLRVFVARRLLAAAYVGRTRARGFFVRSWLNYDCLGTVLGLPFFFSFKSVLAEAEIGYKASI